MSPLIKTLLLLATLIVLIFVGDRALSFVLGKVVLESNDRFVSLYNGNFEESPYLLILGNSRAARHLPKQLLEGRTDLAILNAGLGGQSTVMSEILLNDAIEKNGLPERIVIEPTNLFVPVAVGDLQLFGLFSPRIRRFTCDSNPHLCRMTQLFRLMYFNNEVFLRVLQSFVQPKANTLHRRAIPEKALERLRGAKPHAARPVAENVAALKRMLELADSKGVEVIVLMTPYLWLDDIMKQNRADEASMIQALVGDKHVVRNYTNLVSEPKMFRDSVHLNRDGVVKLLGQLEADGVLARN